MWLPRMHFYVTQTPDGLYHVQNMVMGMSGQHHVHMKKGFNHWKADLEPGDISYTKGVCDCGLKPGWVRDHDGPTHYNPDLA